MKPVLLGIVVLAWLGAVTGFAQTAQMTGTISDQTGASVPNTTVTVTNVNTGVARSSITNARKRLPRWRSVCMSGIILSGWFGRTA